MEINLTMKNSFDLLSETIKEKAKGRNIYYLANPGNWGDALIRQGTLKFFRDYGINATELTTKKTDWIKPFLNGGLVLYGGGGAWCKTWNSAKDKITPLSKRFEVIVLPSTFESNYDIKNTVFFRRDEYESKAIMPNSFFCHDMAFYLGNINFAKGEGEGNFFRTDRESSGKFDLPNDNYDISATGDHFSEGITLFKEIAKYSVIHTDRLHISIAACLLNVKAHLYSGSYFKNEAIFRTSIAPYFKNVTFHKVD